MSADQTRAGSTGFKPAEGLGNRINAPLMRLLGSDVAVTLKCVEMDGLVLCYTADCVKGGREFNAVYHPDVQAVSAEWCPVVMDDLKASGMEHLFYVPPTPVAWADVEKSEHWAGFECVLEESSDDSLSVFLPEFDLTLLVRDTPLFQGELHVWSVYRAVKSGTPCYVAGSKKPHGFFSETAFWPSARPKIGPLLCPARDKARIERVAARELPMLVVSCL